MVLKYFDILINLLKIIKINMIRINLTEEQKKRFETAYNTLDIKVSYWIGGMRGFNWVYVPRQYELDITPCNIFTTPEGRTIKEYTIDLGSKGKMRGGFVRLETVKRKNTKQMEKIEQSIDIEKLLNFIEVGEIHRAKEAIGFYN